MFEIIYVDAGTLVEMVQALKARSLRSALIVGRESKAKAKDYTCLCIFHLLPATGEEIAERSADAIATLALTKLIDREEFEAAIARVLHQPRQ